MAHKLFVTLLTLAIFFAGSRAEGVRAQDVAQPSDSTCVARHILYGGELGSARADYARVSAVAGEATSRSGIIRRPSSERLIQVCGGGPWTEDLTTRAPYTGLRLTLLPVRVEGLLLTGYPADRNNGALWAGRGFSGSAAGGVVLDWGVVSGAIAPSVHYQQNADFPVSAVAEGRASRPRSIDWPSRIGTTPFASIEPGQSYLRVDAYNVALGVATENVWIGPGIRSSLLLTNTAPGFPHFFAGTSDPAPVWVGELEFQAFWGRLQESAFFSDVPGNGDRLIAAAVATFQPKGLPGLSLGATRLFTRGIPQDGLGLGDYLALFRNDLTNTTLGDDLSDEVADQMIAVHARWVLPESGFELFGEWARNDRSNDLYDFIVEPDHGRAYLLGFQKVIRADQGWIRLHGEVLNVENSLSRLHRRHGGGYYEHNFVRQGHTHRGQLLGSWTGPGSSSQTLAADLFSGWGSAGVLVERVRRDTDFYFSTESLRRGYPLKMDVELTGGLRGVLFPRSDLEVAWGLAYSRRANRDFLPPALDELERGYRMDSNWNLQLGVTWQPDLSSDLFD